jgi:ABC-type Fe3+/spermidine/putrescine transport system ATPase subunit
MMRRRCRIRDVHKFYRAARNHRCAKGVSLETPVLRLMGPSGSGKTTLLNMLGGIDTPTGSRGGRRLDGNLSGGAHHDGVRPTSAVFQRTTCFLRLPSETSTPAVDEAVAFRAQARPSR